MSIFLEKKDFFNHNGFLLQIYHDIEKDLQGTQIDYFRENLMKTDNIKSVESLEVLNKINEKMLKSPILMTIVYYWNFLAKDILYFKNLVKPFIKQVMQKKCEFCKEMEEL